MSSDPLKALSALVLWVQTHSQTDSAAEFRRNALQQLETQIPFDKAVWADAGADASTGLALRSPELYRIDPALKADVERAASSDPRLPSVMSAPKVAHVYSARPDDPPPYLELLEKLKIGHFISMGYFDLIMGTATGLVLFAEPERGPFSAAHGAFAEAAFPHLMSGWTRCQVTELDRVARSFRAHPLFSAACLGSLINAAEPEFVSLLRREWPDWVGPHLPAPLLDPSTDSARAVYVGKQIVTHAKIAVDTALVVARERSVVDDLTPRERVVAELCAGGLTYKEISAQLSLAPATARNHIAAVHRRLGVTRSSEVATMLAAVRAPWS